MAEREDDAGSVGDGESRRPSDDTGIAVGDTGSAGGDVGSGDGAGARIQTWLADRRLTIARRELRVLGREKTIVLALAIQLFVAGFSGVLVVGLVSISDPGSVEGFEIDAAVTGDASDEMLDAMAEIESVDGQAYSTSSAAFSAFDRGAVGVVFEAREREGRIAVAVTAPEGSIETTLVVAESRSVLRTLERAQQRERAAFRSTQPLALPPTAGGNPYFDFTYTVLLPLLVFLPVFISGSIAVDSVTEEVDRGTLELLRVAPVTMADILTGKALAMIVIVPLQVATWLALLSLNGVAIANPGWLVALATAAATVVVALGIAVAVLTPNRQAAQLVFSVGVLALFVGASVLPDGPANAAARLAIDSATTATHLLVVGYALLALLSVAAIGRLAKRIDPNAL